MTRSGCSRTGRCPASGITSSRAVGIRSAINSWRRTGQSTSSSPAHHQRRDRIRATSPADRAPLQSARLAHEHIWPRSRAIVHHQLHDLAAARLVRDVDGFISSRMISSRRPLCTPINLRLAARLTSLAFRQRIGVHQASLGDPVAAWRSTLHRDDPPIESPARANRAGASSRTAAGDRLDPVVRVMAPASARSGRKRLDLRPEKPRVAHHPGQ